VTTLAERPYLGVVGYLDGLVEVLDLGHGEHGTEDLLEEAHVGGDVGEDGWRDEVAVREVALVDAVAAELVGRALGLAMST